MRKQGIWTCQCGESYSRKPRVCQNCGRPRNTRRNQRNRPFRQRYAQRA